MELHLQTRSVRSAHSEHRNIGPVGSEVRGARLRDSVSFPCMASHIRTHGLCIRQDRTGQDRARGERRRAFGSERMRKGAFFILSFPRFGVYPLRITAYVFLPWEPGYRARGRRGGGGGTRTRRKKETGQKKALKYIVYVACRH